MTRFARIIWNIAAAASAVLATALGIIIAVQGCVRPTERTEICIAPGVGVEVWVDSPRGYPREFLRYAVYGYGRPQEEWTFAGVAITRTRVAVAPGSKQGRMLTPASRAQAGADGSVEMRHYAVRGATAWAFALLAVVPVLRGLLWLRDRPGKKRPVKRPGNLCPTCGYDCRATPRRCPECGTIQAEALVNAEPQERGRG